MEVFASRWLAGVNENRRASYQRSSRRWKCRFTPTGCSGPPPPDRSIGDWEKARRHKRGGASPVVSHVLAYAGCINLITPLARQSGDSAALRHPHSKPLARLRRLGLSLAQPKSARAWSAGDGVRGIAAFPSSALASRLDSLRFWVYRLSHSF